MKGCRGGRRGSAMVQVLIVMAVVLVLAGSMVKLAVFSVRGARRRICRAQCAVLAESVCATLRAAWTGSSGTDLEADGGDWKVAAWSDPEETPVLPEAGVYDLEIADFPGELLVECAWEDGDLENSCLSVRVTASLREVSETAAFWYVPDMGSEEDEDGLD